MTAKQRKPLPTVYRHFDLQADFPVVGLVGSSWISRDFPVATLHFHNCLEIGYLYSGRCVFHFGGETLILDAPCVVLVPPNVPHQNRAQDGCVCRWNWLYADPTQLVSHLGLRLARELTVLQHTLMAENCVLTPQAHPRMVQLIQNIAVEIADKQPNWQSMVRELFCAFFLHLLRQSPVQFAAGSVEYFGAITPALSYIADHYSDPLSIDELARICHLSASHFCRLFKQVLGWTPQEYIQTIRLDRACVLLYNSDQSITRIAQEVGFMTSSGFGRRFKERYHMTPHQWRQRKHRENDPAVTAYSGAVPPPHQHFFPNEYTAKTEPSE